MINFDAQTKKYQDFIESYLSKCFLYSQEPQQNLFSAMRYSLLGGGKRLRPIFVFDFARMCGCDWQTAAPFAAAVEMVHTYSLIHDDLPCMDNDDYRRGKLTNHKVYGEATAVLAGDALLTAAFTEISAAELSSESRVRAVQTLSACAGELGMVGGQVLDMDAENRECTKQDVINIQSRKTGALIRAACQLGVIAACGSEVQMDNAASFAEHLGLAFQVRDDMLDIIGNENQLGKAIGADGNKNTFVHLYGIEACEKIVKNETEEALSYLTTFQNTEYMQKLSLWLTDRNK